jgi:nicotinamidase-related amidase
MAVRTDARYALISVGMQNDVVHEDGFLQAGGYLASTAGDRGLVVDNVRRLMEATRNAERPVIHAKWGFRPDYLDCCFSEQWRRRGIQEAGVLVDGRWGAEIVGGIVVEADDFIVHAYAHSVLEFTHLDRILRNCGVETCLFVGGPVADGIDDSVRQAAAYGYRVVMVGDAIFPIDPDHLKTLNGRADAITTERVLEMIDFDAMPRPAAAGSPRSHDLLASTPV